ncbi:MAG: low molecular weight phosphotyrosine protein phosphatase [Flavobacteriia bacterium]|nr:low molecular weight phosphotyrosine protein phosphatase [Flavobacteriia bacterium]
MKKILFVCLGNICRSPMADGLLRKKAKELDLHIEIDSAGTANYHVGEAPDYRMIDTAIEKGTDISFLRARQFNKNDFQLFDLIFVMDKNNYLNVLKLSSSKVENNKVKLLLEDIKHPTLKEVPDPFYGTKIDFDNCYQILDDATNLLIEKYLK